MPNPSIKNERVYRALRRKGYAKERAARIANAMAHKDAAPCATCAFKASYGDGITHIRGNLCNVHGRYGRCPGSDTPSSSKPKLAKPGTAQFFKPAKSPAARRAAAAKRRAGGGAGRKPAKSDAQKRQEQDAKRQEREQQRAQEAQQRYQDAADALAQQGAISTQDLGALSEFASGLDLNDAQAQALIDKGLVERDAAGALRMTAAGNRLSAAADRGDVRGALDALSAGREHAAKLAKDKKPKGGGGGKKPPTDADKRAAADAKKRQQATATAQQVGMRPGDVDALRTAAESGGTRNATLERLGLIDANGDATDQGRRALSALERGDTRGYRAALQDATARLGREQAARDRASAADAARQARTRAQAKREQERQQQAQQRAADAAKRARERASAQARRLTLWERLWKTGRKLSVDQQDQLVQAGRAEWTPGGGWRLTKQKAAQPGVLTVLKDARGRDRWLSITTTAYRDQDREIITTKALAKVVAIGDTLGQRGPLRYWHVPGMDFGDCDYQATAQEGRFLIESGTFRSPAAARFGHKLAAAGYQMSPGFVHPRSQPDPRGCYEDIAIFERSAVPRGRAANLFTRFTAKEQRMLTDEKKKELSALLGDQPDLLNQLLSQVQTTDKAAQDQAVAFKEAAPDVASQIAALEQQIATLKAAALPPAIEDKAAPPMADDGDGADAEDPADEAMDDGPIIGQADAELIAQAVATALAPMLNMEKKVAGYLEEMKGMLGTTQTAKDATLAELQAAVARQGATLKELIGDLPSAVLDRAGGVYRPSAGAALPANIAAALKQADGSAPPANLSPDEATTYQFLFGNG